MLALKSVVILVIRIQLILIASCSSETALISNALAGALTFLSGTANGLVGVNITQLLGVGVALGLSIVVAEVVRSFVLTSQVENLL